MNAPAPPSLPLAVECLTLATHGDYDFLRGYLAGKDSHELAEAAMCLATICAGALDAAYSGTDVEWLPSMCTFLMDRPVP